VLDTSKVATDTIDYVATDPTGLPATSTRSVIIEVAPPISPPACDRIFNIYSDRLFDRELGVNS
jgi:hypothetical protein